MGYSRSSGGIGRRLLLNAAAFAGAGVLVPAWARAQPQPDRAAVAELIKDWPKEAKAAVEEMLAKYGPPQEATPTQLHWQANRPWARSVVHKSGVEHDFPAKHLDVLEQAVPYRVPLNFFEALATFNGSIVPDRTRGELVARCDREASNILALNLAHDIIRGQRSVSQARDAMAAGVREIQAGRMPDDARELRLGPPQGDLRDPDTAAITSAPGQGPAVAPATIR